MTFRAYMVWATSLVACGGSGAPPSHDAGAPAATITPPAAPDDVVVAKVGDRLVYGSCVADQVKRGALDHVLKTPRQALDECIGFELLAQEAERRGLATDASVIDATRTALVRRLIDVWQATHGVEVLRPQIDDLFRRAGPADIDPPERRESWNLLVQVKKPEDDAPAKALAEALYAALPGTTAVFSSDLEAAIKAVPNPAHLEVVAHAFQPIAKNDEGVVAPYRGALFALTEIGQVTPVTKSQFGYHVILLTGVEPGKHVDYKDAEPLLFGITRAQTWRAYIDKLVAQHTIEKHPELLSPSKGQPSGKDGS